MALRAGDLGEERRARAAIRDATRRRMRRAIRQTAKFGLRGGTAADT